MSRTDLFILGIMLGSILTAIVISFSYSHSWMSSIMEEEMEKPTCEEIFFNDKGEFEKVDRKVDDGWRHGSYVFEIYYREKDESFWGVSYRLSTDGVTNEFREGIAEINKVEPIQVTKTEWKIV